MTNPSTTDAKAENDLFKIIESKTSWATNHFVRKPPAFASVFFLYIFVGGIVVALGYAYFAKIKIAVDAQGSIVTAAKIVPIKARTSGPVKRIFVELNQTVTAGSKLIETDALLNQEQLKYLRKSFLGVAEELNKSESDCLTECRRILARFEGKDLSGVDLPIAVQERFTRLQTARNDWRLARQGLKDLALSNAEDVRQIKIAQQQLAEIEKSNAASKLSVEVERLKSQIGAARSRLTSARLGAMSRLNQTKNSLGIEIESINKFTRDHNELNAITAPISGSVIALAVAAPGQLITTGEEVMRILPESSELIAEVKIANKDIGDVKIGMPVLLKIDAFPSREFGSIDGRISDLSKTAISSDSQASFFLANVKIDPDSARKNPKIALRYGLTLQAKIISKEKSLLRLGVEKIFNLKDAFTGEAS